MTLSHTYRVAGMSCDHCVRAVTSAVERVDGVRAVEVDLAMGRVTVTVDVDRPIDDEAVRAAIDDAGYEVVS
jgi:copper ion binding protein